MKYLFRLLGISLTELSYLLLVSEQTLHSWLRRSNTVPAQYRGYWGALEVYAQQRDPAALESLRQQSLADNAAALAAQGAAAIRELDIAMQNCTLQLEKLRQKEKKLLSRWHLSAHYAAHLPADIQNAENVQEWCALIGRKARLQLHDTQQALARLEQKMAGLAAERAYWENNS